MKLFGLIGNPLQHSFSKKYFEEKFVRENISGCSYLDFELKSLDELDEVIKNNPALIGLNVTIPFKISILEKLDELDDAASKIGAVNTIKIYRGEKIKLKGYNTDVIGFEKSLAKFLSKRTSKALILGTGGSSKAVAYILKKLGIEYLFVSREKKNDNTILYSEIDSETLKKNKLIINCTPLGKFPEVNLFPPLPYEFLDSENFLFDLNYNPSETKFLQLGKMQGCTLQNGLEMLHLQAEASWNIWNQT